MNRNTNSRFAVSPVDIDVPRSQFRRDSDHLLSGSVGDLIPFYLDEKLPGDTDKIVTSSVVRFNTLLKPIYGNMYLDTYYFFVPNRLIMDHWKNFCGESEKAWRPQLEYAVPQIGCDVDRPHPGVGSLADYLGVPLTFDGMHFDQEDAISALPFRAYAKICNDWFRSEALQDELVIPTDQNSVAFNSKDDSDLFCAYGGPLFKVGKLHDYFTSCLPDVQAGPSVKIPVSGNSPSDFYPVMTRDVMTPSVGSVPLAGHLSGVTTPGSAYPLSGVASDVPGFAGAAYVSASSASSTSPSHDFTPSNLWASVGITVGTISELRMAFQVQKYYEKLNSGRRYIEVLKSMFGVTSPDARMQRSEYLGGKRITLRVSEVTANAQSEGIDLGDLAGMSRTTDVDDSFIHSYTEHGYVIGLLCVRYEHSYPQGLDRHWLRRTTFDYYWPVFANISNQPVFQAEINYTHAGGISPHDVFGYQEAWADYRFKRSTCAGYMRPEAPTPLSSWHLADYYNPAEPGPFLSEEWLREDAANVDRVLAVQSSLTHQFTADIFVRNMCTRVMPMYSIPGLADHH